MITDLKDFARKQARDCRLKARQYDVWLAYLTPCNFILVSGAAILSLLAGSSLLVEIEYLTPVRAGLMAITAGVLTILHQTLNCEKHQQECRKLRGTYDAIAHQFTNLEIETEEGSIKKKIDDLGVQIAFLRENYSARPPLWIIKGEENKAKGQLPSSPPLPSGAKQPR